MWYSVADLEGAGADPPPPPTQTPTPPHPPSDPNIVEKRMNNLTLLLLNFM